MELALVRPLEEGLGDRLHAAASPYAALDDGARDLAIDSTYRVARINPKSFSGAVMVRGFTHG